MMNLQNRGPPFPHWVRHQRRITVERKIAIYALIGLVIGAAFGAAFGSASGNILPGLGFGSLLGAGLGWFLAVAIAEQTDKS